MKSTKFSDKPETSDPVLRIVRNASSFWHDGSLVYIDAPDFTNWDVAEFFNWISKNGTPEQYKDINDMYNDKVTQNVPFPFGSAINSFCEKHDHAWYDKHQILF
jgi:hypothetical protein